MTTHDDRVITPLIPLPRSRVGEIVPINLDALPAETQTINILIVSPSRPTIAPVEPKRSLLRKTLDDPYWALISIAAALSIGIVTLIVYGVIQIVLAVEAWLAENMHTIVSGGATVLIILVLLSLGGGGAVCAGLHCAGCRR